MAARNIKGITIKIGANTTELSNALKNVNSDLKTAQDGLKDVDKLLKLDPGNVELLRQKQDYLNESIASTKERLEKEKQALEQMKNTEGFDKNSEQARVLQRQIEADELALKDLQQQAKEFGSVGMQQFKLVGAKVQEVGQKMTQMGKTLTRNVTTPIVGISAAAVKITADFDTSMSKVSAISGATGDDFDALRLKAREMGATTKFSASEAADAMTYMAMAGWKTEDMLEGIEGIMNLAAASGEDLATTSDIVTDALTAFGMTAADAGRFADVLAATSANANTNVSMMGETFKYAAPVAGALGYSVEDVAIAAGLMGNAGIKASEAGTTLRNIFTRMAKPTKESAEAMERLGVALYDDEGRMYSFQEIMDQLRESFGHINMPIEEFNAQMAELDRQLEEGEITETAYAKATEELALQAYGAEGAEKARAAAMLAGQRGMSGLLAIVNASTEDYQKLTDAVYGSAGAAEHMASVMEGNLNGQITVLKSALQELAISFGDILVPVISDFVGHIQKLVNWLNSLDESQRKTIVAISAIVAAAGPVLVILGSIVNAIGALIPVIGVVVGLLTGPFALAFVAAGAAIAAVIVIGKTLIANWDQIKADALKFKADLVARFNEIKDNVTQSIEELKTKLSEKWTQIKTTVTDKARQIKSDVEQKFEQLKNNVNSKVETMKSNITSKFEAIRAAISDKINAAKEAVHSAIEAMKGFFNFHWELPHIALPHFSVSGSANPLDWLTEGVPHISVDWYRKAYENPVLFTSPTILQTAAGLKGFGDGSGAEIVMGLNKLRELVGSSSGDNIEINVYGAQGQDVTALAYEVERVLVRAQKSRSAVFA